MINLENFWEALGAIGTVGFVLTTLYLARRDYKKKLDVDHWLDYELFSGDKIPLWAIDLVNRGMVPIKIYEIGITHASFLRARKKKIIFLMPRDFSADSADLPILLPPQEDATYFLLAESYQKIQQSSKKKFRIYAQDSTGKYYFSKPFKLDLEKK